MSQEKKIYLFEVRFPMLKWSKLQFICAHNDKNIHIRPTVCCRVEQPTQKIPRGFSLFQCSVFIGDSESVEKNILQQGPLGVTS